MWIAIFLWHTGRRLEKRIESLQPLHYIWEPQPLTKEDIFGETPMKIAQDITTFELSCINDKQKKAIYREKI